MLNDEAQQYKLTNWNASEGNRQLIKTNRSYFIIILSLFAVIVALCCNNRSVYSLYINTRQQLEDINMKVNTILNDKQEVDSDKENLNKQNEALKAKFAEITLQNEEIQKQIAEIKKNSNELEIKNDELARKNSELTKKNDELTRKSKEIVDDNIALQNTLKKAASVGIKPQNFTEYKEVSSRGNVERERYLGKFLGTAYTPSKEECGNNYGITNSGEPIIPGVSIAIDPKYWPFGTVFYIKGLGYAVAMDTGSAIKGKNRFDLAVLDKKFAKELGVKYWDVYLVSMGKGYVEKNTY